MCVCACFMFNACVHVRVPPYISPSPLPVCAATSARGLFFIPRRALHRCRDACLCIAIVRKCHRWHLTGASEPTRACLLATCGPTSPCRRHWLACLPRPPFLAVPLPQSARLGCPGPVKDQSGEHNSIYRGVFDWRPCGEVAAMQLHRPS